MSRIYRALEKAEEEKRQKVKEEPSSRIFEEKEGFKKEEPILKFPEKEIKELNLPLKEEIPVMIVPPSSFAGEEFRKLKAQIFQRLPNPPQSILITSATPQEGKTIVAVNLALTISREIHKKAIFVNGDLRKPGVLLGKSQSSKGLSNYLSDGTPLSDVLASSNVENLKFIQTGSSTSRPSELIGSKRMEELIKSLKEIGNDTYIIIDSPPIIPTSEPALLSKMVDGIILVVMAERTPKGVIQRALKSIDNQKIIGILLNQLNIKPSSYYSKYYYKYYGK